MRLDTVAPDLATLCGRPHSVATIIGVAPTVDTEWLRIQSGFGYRAASRQTQDKLQLVETTRQERQKCPGRLKLKL